MKQIKKYHKMFPMKYNEESKIWRGSDTPMVYNMKGSLGSVLLRGMENNATKIAQVSKIFHDIERIS